MNIIQIGCHDGNDHVKEFIKENIEKIDLVILVDANPNVIPECKTNYSESIFSKTKIEILNYAIVKNMEKIPILNLYIPKNEKLSQHCSYSYAHMAEHHHKELDTISVPTLTLTKLCSLYGITNLEHLYIDAEGLDVDILSSFNMKNHIVNNIFFEYAHSDGPFSKGGPKLESLTKALENLGYSCSKDLHNLTAKRNIPSGV